MYIQCKRLFTETVSTKKHGQVSLEKKVYQEALVVSFTENPPAITTDTHKGEQISSTPSNTSKSFPQKLWS